MPNNRSRQLTVNKPFIISSPPFFNFYKDILSNYSARKMFVLFVMCNSLFSKDNSLCYGNYGHLHKSVHCTYNCACSGKATPNDVHLRKDACFAPWQHLVYNYLQMNRHKRETHKG